MKRNKRRGGRRNRYKGNKRQRQNQYIMLPRGGYRL